MIEATGTLELPTQFQVQTLALTVFKTWHRSFGLSVFLLFIYKWDKYLFHMVDVKQ
jgi:hypothetical protein